MPGVRRARSRIPLWRVHVRGLQELLWEDVQQPVGDPGVQKQLQVRRGQEEQDRVQGVQAEEVPHGRHVQVRLQVREEVQLVQDPLPHAEERSEALQQLPADVSSVERSSDLPPPPQRLGHQNQTPSPGWDKIPSFAKKSTCSPYLSKAFFQ